MGKMKMKKKLVKKVLADKPAAEPVLADKKVLADKPAAAPAKPAKAKKSSSKFKGKETLLPPDSDESSGEEHDVDMSGEEVSVPAKATSALDQTSVPVGSSVPLSKKNVAPVAADPSDEEDMDEDMEGAGASDEDEDLPSDEDEAMETSADAAAEKPSEDYSPSDKPHPNDPYLLADAEYIKTDPNWKNKQRTLIFSSRGIGNRHRHLMEDLKKCMPHHKSESKWDKSDFKLLNEVAELKSCNNVCYFEARRHQDLFMHLARVPHGPTFKFQVLNIHTADEVRLSGNCLLGSRPLLTFDESFEKLPHLTLMKEMFIQAFGTPRNHPKAKPFHDHVMSFFNDNGKIWIRHYQISPLTDADADLNDPEKQVLTEIGPRMVLHPVHILNNSFGGSVIFKNEQYATPTAARREERKVAGEESKLKMETKERSKLEKEKLNTGEAAPEEAIFEKVEA